MDWYLLLAFVWQKTMSHAPDYRLAIAWHLFQTQWVLEMCIISDAAKIN